MIKAVIFDCFGVLATEAWLPFKAKYFSHDPELFQQATEIRRQADRGLISYADSIHAIAELAGITPAEVAQAIEGNAPNEELFAYIKKLKKSYKLGLLSNIAGNYLRHIFTEQQLALFDSIALSYQRGFVKPQAEAFTNAAEELDVATAECVFIDNQQRHVDGARAAGMQAVLYENFAQFKKEFEAIVGKISA